jgi:hypothetical protein
MLPVEFRAPKPGSQGQLSLRNWNGLYERLDRGVCIQQAIVLVLVLVLLGFSLCIGVSANNMNSYVMNRGQFQELQ